MLLNCFILLVPVFLLNLLCAKQLPKPYQAENFWKDIPAFIGTMENIMRIIVFIVPLFLKLALEEPRQKIGLLIYIAGIIFYFASWMVQIYFQESSWSKSLFGFAAPAYTTIIWFVGIGLIGKSLLFDIPYHYSIYIGLAAVFVVFHSMHAYIVHSRL
jgi:hypothetical protein